MKSEYPPSTVVVSVEQPLEQRLAEHPLGPGQVYHFKSEKNRENGFDTQSDLRLNTELPNPEYLEALFQEVNDSFSRMSFPDSAKDHGEKD